MPFAFDGAITVSITNAPVSAGFVLILWEFLEQAYAIRRHR